MIEYLTRSSAWVRYQQSWRFANAVQNGINAVNEEIARRASLT